MKNQNSPDFLQEKTEKSSNLSEISSVSQYAPDFISANKIRKLSILFGILLILQMSFGSLLLMGSPFKASACQDCSDADLVFDVDIWVVGDGCHSGQKQDSETINIPVGGMYSIYAEVHRSGPGQSQPAEDFTLTINGATGPEVLDRPGDETIRIQYAGDFNLTSGSNLVIMDTAAQCPLDGTDANSVSVAKLCLHYHALPMVEVPVRTCLGQGELYLYQGDPFQPINTSFTVSRDQVLVFTKNNPTLSVKVDGVDVDIEPPVKTSGSINIYSIETSPGAIVSIIGEHNNWNARAVQGYLAQNASDPVYDINSLQVIYNAQQSNDMYLTANTYSYIFFDKYSINQPGQGVDNRPLTAILEDSVGGEIFNKTYTQPFPSPAEGVVTENFIISENGEYTLSVNTEDSIYWLLADCPVPQPDPLVIRAYKVVCEAEEYLPNWGTAGAEKPARINADTAADYVKDNNYCWLENDWSFQWGFGGIAQKQDGNHIGPAPDGTGWNAFTTVTGENGEDYAEVKINDIGDSDKLWIRENLKEGYVPFINPPGDLQNPYSAELYCETDILNYDNYDWIKNPQYEETYYCVAFNALKPGPYCGDGIVNQAWEECDDGNDNPEDGCYACQIDDVCSDLVLARVNVNEVSNATPQANMTSDIYLGSDSNIIPAGAWFPLYWQEAYYTDSDISGYEDVPGLAVQRLEGNVRAVLHGSLGSADIEHINGNIEFYNATVMHLRDDKTGNNQLENDVEIGGYNDSDGTKAVQPGDDEVWVETGDTSHSYFWLTTNIADDGYYTDWDIIEDCKDKICGHKQNSYTQQGIEGWKIFLKDMAGYEIASTTTDINGNYCFNQVEAGDYRIEEELRAGWNYNDYYFQDITYTGEELILVNFSNYQDSSITVCKYIDIDGLASTTDDQYLATTTVWTFILDNGTATSSQETFEGCTVFNDLDSGEYAITEELVENWIVLDPESGEATTTLESGQTVTINFVNYYSEPVEPYCGDGVQQGNEECDLGANNGVLCQAGYGGTCEYCSNVCTIIELSGPYCGDGIVNGNEQCDDGNNNSGDGCSASCQNEGGGGGGGGGGSTPLAVRNEQISCLSETSVIITWLTNKYSTSRVVYGAEQQTSIGAAPNYGYEYSTIEDTDKVIDHSAVIENLIGNAVYYFKPISHASPDVFGKELGFDMATCCSTVVLGEEGAPILTIEKHVMAEFANPGDENVAYKIIIANTGNLTAFNTILTDTLPTGFTYSDTGSSTQTWQINDFNPGQTEQVEYLVNIASDTAAGIYANIAQVSADNHGAVSASADLEVKIIKVLPISGIDRGEYILLIIIAIKLLIITQIIRRKYLNPYNVFNVKLENSCQID